MIAHVMLWIQRCGIHDITIVTPSAAAPKISHAIRAVTEDSTMVAFITSDDCQGSADALRLVRDRIKYDVFVVGCDFITDMDPHRFLDMYRLSKDTAVTAIFYESSDIKDEDTAQFVGVTPDQQLVAILEASQRELPIRASLLWK
jgi:NDP-sugar pyrophosphorylase family protein